MVGEAAGEVDEVGEVVGEVADEVDEVVGVADEVAEVPDAGVVTSLSLFTLPQTSYQAIYCS